MIAARKARWEAHCRRCGLCCYEKEYRGSSVVTNFNRPCPHLDLSSRLCTVYESRFETCAQCRKMTILHAMFVPWLPSSCGYVQHYRPRRTSGTRRLA
ncbi:MAG: YkgJ family cysteine cluster protein [Spirochaetia bacterium]